MPIYNYECEQCGNKIEKIVRGIPKDGPDEYIEEPCSCKDCSESGRVCDSEKKCRYKRVITAHGKHASWTSWRIKVK